MKASVSKVKANTKKELHVHNRHTLIVFICLFFLISNMAYAQDKTSFAAIDSADLKNLAKELKHKDIYAGIFELPGMDTRIRYMKNGDIPEMDTSYRRAMVQYSLTKLYPLTKGDFDSVVFVKIPVMMPETADPGAMFFSYPGTTWLLLLRKCYTPDGKPQNWLKEGGLYKDKRLFTSSSAFYIDNPVKWNYVISWNDIYPHSSTMIKIDKNFGEDIAIASDYIRSNTIIDKDSKAKFSAMMKTKEGKYIAAELVK